MEINSPGSAGVGAPTHTAPLRFMQVHTFYPQVLEKIYLSDPSLARESYESQTVALWRSGFSAIHMFAHPMRDRGYETRLVIANCVQSQKKWLQEQNIGITGRIAAEDLVRKQIETFKPDVLYLSDPISFDGKFISSL